MASELLAGLEKVLAIVDLLSTEELAEILVLARKVPPWLVRSG